MASVTIRKARPEDVPAAAQICFDAFSKINTAHGFPPDIPSPEVAEGFLSLLFTHPGFHCVVAEVAGRLVGSNCLDERSAIAGVGPITVELNEQNRGVGRKLMEAVMERSQERRFPGIRLVQAAFHNRSLSLYTTLGFDAREPLSVMTGPAIGKQVEGCTVRAAQASDLDACNRVCREVHGHDRKGEVADAVGQNSVMVVERHGRITGYAARMGFFGHSVAESNLDLEGLIAAAGSFSGPGILVPTRNASLFRWCLANGLRVVEPMTLMAMGLYNEPEGAFLPSITF